MGEASRPHFAFLFPSWTLISAPPTQYMDNRDKRLVVLLLVLVVAASYSAVHSSKGFPVNLLPLPPSPDHP